MKLSPKNYQENIVLSCIDVIVRDSYPEIKNDMELLTDIASYVLNRIPPNYIMSERGFTRLMMRFGKIEKGENIDIMYLTILINKAIQLLRFRRKSPTNTKIEEYTDEDEKRLTYIHSLSKITGQVINDHTEEPIHDAQVTLNIDGEIMEPVLKGWPNPITTTSETQGWFAFMFYHKMEQQRDKKIDELIHEAKSHKYNISIVVKHDEYSEKVLQKEVFPYANQQQNTPHQTEDVTDGIASIIAYNQQEVLHVGELRLQKV